MSFYKLFKYNNPYKTKVFYFFMIASIDYEWDIDLYFSPEEIITLERGNTLEGVLVKIHTPKLQGKIYVSVNDERKNENGFGIGLIDRDFSRSNCGEIEVFIGDCYFQLLKSRGKIGTRHHLLGGSKINLMDISKIGGIQKLGKELLEFYRDNKEKLNNY